MDEPVFRGRISSRGRALATRLEPTRYDVLLAIRTLLAALILGGIVFAVGMATDERGSSFAERLARLAALLPITGGLASALISSQARSRGEIRALMALGASPSIAVRGALAGSVLIGLLGVLLVVSGAADLRSLFPHVPQEPAWRLVGDAWVNATEGWVVGTGGEIDFRGSAARAQVSPREFVPATALALFVASFALPAWALQPSRPARRLGVALALAMVAVASFHLVGAGRVSSLALSVSPLLLLLDAMSLGRGLRPATKSASP